MKREDQIDLSFEEVQRTGLYESVEAFSGYEIITLTSEQVNKCIGGVLYTTKEGNQKHKGSLLMIDDGLFYRVYGDDAIILNYFFGYKITKGNIVSFPEEAYSKVKNMLIGKGISLQINSKDNRLLLICFVKGNNYYKYLDIALENYNLNNKIENLINKIKDLNQNKLNNLLSLIEDYLNDR